MFRFRLALQLGKTVEELNQTMTYHELVEWMTFYTLEPWGCEVQEYLAAMQTSMIHNVNVQKRHQARDISHFMVLSDGRRRRISGLSRSGIKMQSRREMWNQLMAAAQHQRKVKKIGTR